MTDVSQTAKEVPTVEVTVEYLCMLRKEIGLRTAEVWWEYGLDENPYGDHLDLPEQWQQVGRQYFARLLGSEAWIDFGDLPTATRDALWEKHKAKLAFPAGLPRLTEQTS